MAELVQVVVGVNVVVHTGGALGRGDTATIVLISFDIESVAEPLTNKQMTRNTNEKQHTPTIIRSIR